MVHSPSSIPAGPYRVGDLGSYFVQALAGGVDVELLNHRARFERGDGGELLPSRNSRNAPPAVEM